MGAEAKVKELGLKLPPIPKPAGVYKPMVVAGDYVYVSGHGPLKDDGSMTCGRVGTETDLKGGYEAARQCGLVILSTLRHGLGSLDRVKRVVKILGMVNAAPDFTQHPGVINGCSELFREVWGEDHGVGARSAVGMGSLPGNITAEVEVIFELAK